jgi:hypothetical protein
MTFRLIVQRAVAAFFAIRSGVHDARAGRTPYGWVIFTNPIRRCDLLREGVRDIAKVFAAAFVMDLVYQVIEFGWFYPGEAVIVAAVLAMLPYLLLRGPVNRIARHWRAGELR